MLTALEFVSIAALWGGSFLFVRLAGPEFGAIPLIGLRTLIAALALVLVCYWRDEWCEIQKQWSKVWILGLTVTAAPFTLLAYTTLLTNAGFGAIVNSTVPFFTAVIARVWLKEKLTTWQAAGLAIGFLGVCLLVGGKASFDSTQKTEAVVIGLAATFLYGFSINYNKKFLAGVSPVVINTVSQISGTMMMFPLMVWKWPDAFPSSRAWMSAIALGVGSTSLAFVLFYRLVAKVGATRTAGVTFLVPVFGMVWGASLLDEKITLSTIAAAAVILLGTALSTGIIHTRRFHE